VVLVALPDRNIETFTISLSLSLINLYTYSNDLSNTFDHGTFS